MLVSYEADANEQIVTINLFGSVHTMVTLFFLFLAVWEIRELAESITRLSPKRHELWYTVMLALAIIVQTLLLRRCPAVL